MLIGTLDILLVGVAVVLTVTEPRPGYALSLRTFELGFRTANFVRTILSLVGFIITVRRAVTMPGRGDALFLVLPSGVHIWQKAGKGGEINGVKRLENLFSW